jgi:hypothetical protein
MQPGSRDQSGPVVEYLLKEVSFSTCDNRFFGELEKEMLVPNNITIFARIREADNLENYRVRVKFLQDTAIGYIKKPLSDNIEANRKVLTYKLVDLINYDDYWWLPLKGETEFRIQLNLLPPFPQIAPVGLEVACRPDVVIGLNPDVTTTVRLQAIEDIDNISLSLTAPQYGGPGVSMAITEYSDASLAVPTQTVSSPRREFPYPRLSLRKGQTVEYKTKTRITSDPSKMNFLRCQQDIMNVKLLALSNTSPAAAPCSVSIVDEDGNEMPVEKTVRSTVLQVNAQVMYSPYSIRKETPPIPTIATAAQ